MARVMREPLPTDAVDLEAHLTRAEAGVAHLRPGAARQVVWAATPGDVSDVAVVYVHGFSASAAEIRPVPDAVAEALGANLYFARLTGHGTDGDDMGRARLPDWQADVAEAMAIGRMIGRRVIVMGCSTGCPLILSEMARDDAGVAGVVFVSPNIALANGAVQKLLRLPLARRWVPWIMGRRRSFEPESPAHAAAWTVEYDSQAVFTMMDAVRAGEAIDPAQFDAPLLMIGNPGDQMYLRQFFDL